MRPNAIHVVSSRGTWIVRVFDKGSVDERKFDLEAGARSWVEGQQVRMRLDSISVFTQE